MAKKFLHKHNVEYQEIDAAVEREAWNEMFKKTNTRIGFNPYFYSIGFPYNKDIDTEDDWNIVESIIKGENIDA